MRSTVTAVAVCSAVALVACGDDDATTTGESAATTTTEAAQAPGEISQITGSKPAPDIRAGALEDALPESVNGMKLKRVDELPALLDAGADDAAKASYANTDAIEGFNHELALFGSSEDAETWRERVVEYVTAAVGDEDAYRVEGEEAVTGPDGAQVGTVTLLHAGTGRDYSLLWTNGAVYGAIDTYRVGSPSFVAAVYDALPY